MKFNLLENYLTAATNEGVVRSYHCTSLASLLLGIKAEGFLTVTNKRVVFYALGKSFSGVSILSSEVPIEDVSGISTYKGTYFNIGRFLAAMAAGIVAGTFGTSLLAGLTALIGGALLADLFDVSGAQATIYLVALVGLGFLVVSGTLARDRIWKPVCASVGASLLSGPGLVGLTLGAFSQLLGGRGDQGLSNLLVIVGFFAGIYALVTMFWYARSEGMSLTIGSKGGAQTPIAISGISVFGLFTTGAYRALNAAPAPDAAGMIKELGAMISDIQTSGDLGARKWLPAESNTGQQAAQGDRQE